MASSDNKTSSVERSSLRDVVGGFLFYFGIPAATLYPLGFVALSLQLWRDPDFPYTWASSGFNFAMLYYAASLVPKVVVVGTGVRLLFLSLLATLLSLAAASITLHLLRRWKLVKGGAKYKEPEGMYRREPPGKWERYFWLLSLIFVLPATVLLLSRNFPFDSWYDALFMAVTSSFRPAAAS